MSYLISKNIDQQSIKPLYLFHGEEEFLISEVIAKIISNIKKKQTAETQFLTFDAQETNLSQILNAARTSALFETMKIIIVKDFEHLIKDDFSNFISYCKKPLFQTCLILSANKNISEQKLIEAVQNHGSVIQFNLLKDGETLNWINENLRKRGFQINPPAVKHLLELCGNNLRRINNELEKIITYLDNRKIIDLETLTFLTKDTAIGNIFKLTDAIGDKNINQALKHIEKICQTDKEPPLKILGMIVRQIRIMLQIKSLKETGASSDIIAKNTGLKNPFALSKFIKQSQNFSLEELKQKLLFCLTIDKKIKSTSLKGKLILEELLIELCK